MRKYLLYMVLLMLGTLAAFADEATGVNALKILLRNGDEHYIAIDGKNLELNVDENIIRLGNSGITVEYSTEETSSFIPVNYTFPNGELFVGDNSEVRPVFDDVIGLSLSGNILSIYGIKGKEDVNIYSLSGLKVRTSEVKNGLSEINVSTLSRDTYIVRVDGKSIKIILGE